MAKLYFYYSAMNAGKSTMLLQADFNYRERGMQTILYCPLIDTRFGAGHITSRIGLKAEAETIDANLDLYYDVVAKKMSMPNLACVLVDEAQFLSKAQIEALCRVVDELDLPVLCYGIRSDFQGNPFEGSLYLLAWADELVEVKSICFCGRKAVMNMRTDAFGLKVTDGDQIQIGGNESYVSTCRRHFSSSPIPSLQNPALTERPAGD